jgi:hypothetical protein
LSDKRLSDIGRNRQLEVPELRAMRKTLGCSPLKTLNHKPQVNQMKQRSKKRKTVQINNTNKKTERSNDKMPNKTEKRCPSKETPLLGRRKIADISHGTLRNDTAVSGPVDPLRSLKPLARHSIGLQWHPEYNGWHLCAEFDCDGDNGGPIGLDDDATYRSLPEALGAAVA